jgi:hypothetical protein
MMHRRLVQRLVVVFVYLALARIAQAQFPQYIPPGSLGIPSVTDYDELQKSLGNAPWRVGPMRFQPYFVLRDVGYVDNVFPSGAEVSDVTATAGAGIKAFLPLGSKVTLAAHVLPEYVWWDKFDELSGFRHRAGLGLFAHFNRLTFELKYTDSELLQYITQEVDSPGDIGKRSFEFNAEVELGGSLAVFAGATQGDYEYDDNGFDFAFPDQIELLDRSEEIARLGLKYKRASGFEIGFGYEDTQIDFDTERRDRSNQGSGYVVTLQHIGSRIGASADVVYREIEEVDGSQFREYKAWTGGGRLQYRTQGRFGASLFGNRQIVYSLSQGTSYFVDERIGTSLEMRIGWRTDLRAFYEVGEDDYEPLLVGAPRRIDDFDSVGAEFQMKLRETSTFLASVARTTYDSNFDQFDRELTTVRLTINIGGSLLGW